MNDMNGMDDAAGSAPSDTLGAPNASGIGLWIGGARPKTLPLAVAPVVAASMAMWTTVFEGVYGGSYMHRPCPVVGGRPPIVPGDDYGTCLTSPGWYVAVTLLCVGVALFLQIAANFANDYADGVRGTDAGRGAAGKAPVRLVASGVPPKRVLLAAGVNAAFACACGLAIVVLTGHWWFIALGLVCILAGWCYVGGRRPYGYHGWGEVSVFVFFGLVATCGTAYALSDRVPFLVIWTAVAQGAIAVAVLCVNNLRDIDEDAAHGKRTWMVRLGARGGRRLTDVLILLPPLMMLASFLSRAWMLVRAFHPNDVCRADGVGGTVCAAPSVLSIDSVSAVAAFAFLAATIALCVASVSAVRRRRFGAALPLCTVSSLTSALGFGFLYLIGV